MNHRPRQLGPYQLFEVLGEGGMGVVYRARHEGLNRTVALKLLLESWLSETDVRLRFVREMKLMASLNHINLVKIFDCGEIDERGYIAMELVEGESLGDLARREGSIAPAQVLGWAVQIADGLDYLHRQKILHRDIKPSNLLLERGGTVKILDFGLARREGGTLLTEEGSTVGTALYLAPEVISDGVLSEASDMWALGISLYYLLSGKPAVTGISMPQLMERIVNEPIVPLHLVEPRVPEPVSAFVAALLEKDPGKRPGASMAGELAERLLVEVRSGRARPGREPRASPVTPATPPVRSRGVLWVTRVTQVSILALLGVALGAGWRGAMAPSPELPASATPSAPVSLVPSPANPNLFDQWKVLLPDIERTIQDPGQAVKDLQAKSPIDLGDRPEVWRLWVALGQWLERPDPGPPPRLPGVRAAAPDPFTYRVTRYKLEEVAGKHGPGLLALTIRGIAIVPDGAGTWLVFGRILDWEGRDAEALRAYRHGLELLPRDFVASWIEHYWIGLIGALRRTRGPDWLDGWWPVTERTDHVDRTWWALYRELLEDDPAEFHRVIEAGLDRPRHFVWALQHQGNLMLRQENRREAFDLMTRRLTGKVPTPELALWLVHEALVQGQPDRGLAYGMHLDGRDRPLLPMALELPGEPDPHPTFRGAAHPAVAAVEILRLVEIGAVGEAEGALAKLSSHPSRGRLALEVLGAGGLAPWLVEIARAGVKAGGVLEASLAPSVIGPKSPVTLDDLVGELDFAPLVRALGHSRKDERAATLELMKAYRHRTGCSALEVEVFTWPHWKAMIGAEAVPESLDPVGALELESPHDPFAIYYQLLRKKELAGARRMAERYWDRQPMMNFWKVAVLHHAVHDRDRPAFEHWHARNVASVRFMTLGLWVIALGRELRGRLP